MRRVTASLFVFLMAAVTPGTAYAESWQALSFEGDTYENDAVDPAYAMRLRIHQTADRSMESSERLALSPCKLEHSPKMRAVCWSSYGRNLHMILPTLAYDALAMLQPHTLYSYKALDLRFPPAVRIRLPFDGTTTVGYEYDEELIGVRLRFNF